MVAFIVFFFNENESFITNKYYRKKEIARSYKCKSRRIRYTLKKWWKWKKRGKKKITEFNKRLVTNRKSLAVFYSG